MNNLETHCRITRKLWKLQPRPKVTIGIGLICKERDRPRCIILASDSQTTYPGAAKSLDTQKISVVDFSNGQILVAQSGIAELADKAIEIMQKKANGLLLENFETAISIAEESVREIRNHLQEINSGCNFSDDGWKRFFRDENNFTLMLAYYFDRKPYLYTIDLDWCLPVKVKLPYKGIGIGKDYAEIMLREYWQSDQDFEYGYPIAVSVVEKVIDNVDGCGRPTWLGRVWPVTEDILQDWRERDEHLKSKGLKNTPYLESQCSILKKEDVDIMVKELKLAELKEVPEKKSKMDKVFFKASAKYKTKWNKERKASIKSVEKEMNKRGLKYEKIKD